MTKVLVHGVPETEAIWGPLITALAGRGVDDVVTLSPPGFGAPAPEEWDPVQDGYRDWLLAELDRIDGEVDLVGHDWGAGHVLGALAHREGLVRTWASDCVGLIHPDYEWHDTARLFQTPEAGEQVVAGLVGDSAAVLEGLGLPPEVADPMAEGIDEEMGRCILALYRSAAQPAMADLGRRFAAAAPPNGLVLVPTDDPFAGPPAMPEEMAGMVGAGVARLEGRGHWWMVEDPEGAADVLTAHWAAG